MNPIMKDRISFDELNATLKAAGDGTRLRILCLLEEAELTVSELTEILRQSQPRISRHLKLLVEAGLVERFREGSWAFFRRIGAGPAATVAGGLIEALDPTDPTIARDRDRESGGPLVRDRNRDLEPIPSFRDRPERETPYLPRDRDRDRERERDYGPPVRVERPAPR